MNYLVLHIDLEFIVDRVCTDDGNSYPVTNGNDDLLWLYFFNNPQQNRISFGKENRDHFNNKDINYHGRFFELIENEQETFAIRGIQKKAIELLDESDLLKTLKEKYQSVTHENTDQIPTLVTFSLSISELAKQKTVEYLKTQGFQIESYTIPLSELVCYYPYSRKEFSLANGNAVLLLAATNTSLHLMKLVFSDNYFVLNGEVKTYKGKGIDPRKRALVRFVVNEINKTVGALSNEEEFEDECSRKEAKAGEWLLRMDVQQQCRPLCITESLSKMPHAQRQVFVRKNDIENDTGHYIQELMDIFDVYKSDNVQGDIAAIFLLGDCFQNSLVKDRFNKLIRNEKLFLYANKDIQNILSVYPNLKDNKKNQEEKTQQLLNDAKILMGKGCLHDAKNILLPIEVESKEAKAILDKIDNRLQENENQYRTLIKVADSNFNNQAFDTAISNYRKALELKPDDKYCLEQIIKAENKNKTLKPPLPPIPPVSVRIRDTVVPEPPLAKKPVVTNKGNMPPPPPPKKNGGGNGILPPPPPPPKKK